MKSLLFNLFAFISIGVASRTWRRSGNSMPLFLKVVASVVAGFSSFSCQNVFGETTNLPGYFTRVWSTEDGLPNNAVTAIVQTQDGYLWLATYDGLARFDGVNFTRFDGSTTPEMHSTRVTSLFEDSKQNLWIGYETGELTRYFDGNFYATEFQAPWEQKKILNIGADSIGDIWLLNDVGTLANLKGKVIAPPNAGGAANATALASSPQGTVWVASGGNAFLLSGGTLSLLPLQAGDYVKGVCAGTDGSLWILNQTHLYQWKDGQMSDEGESPLGQSSVAAMTEMKSGCLAVGTLDQGLFLIFPRRGVVHFDRANGFPDNRVRSLCSDREGTLWVGTGSSGLVALRPSRVTTLKPPDDWLGANVLSMTHSHNGALWIGTEGAGLYRLYTNQWAHFEETEGVSNLFVWSVSEDTQNRLWIGTWGGGLFIKSHDHFDPALPTGPDIAVTAILHGQNGVTWVGTTTGLLRYQNGTVTSFGEKEGLVLPDVRALAEEPNGTLWFGMLGGGLGCLQNGVIKQYRKSDGLSSDFVQCLHLDSGGALWIGTYGGGLNCFKHGRFSVIGINQGLPNNYICAIEQDYSNNFWVSSHAGIFRIQKSELDQCADGQIPSVHPLIYGTGDGMPTLECSGGFQPAAFRTSDGQLWFSTSKGVVIINPNDIKRNQLPPPVHIEKMFVDGQQEVATNGTGASLRIAPGHQRFEFDYTGISFVVPEKVVFKYRLEGLDRDWTDNGTKRMVIYSYIPPGSYRFQVTACNSDGIWNPVGATVAFSVRPYFWQTWWFYIVASLAGVTLFSLGVISIARWRMRQKLERLERQRAVERERARIARDIHDNLGANLTRISLLSQSAQGDLHNPVQAAAQLDRIYETTRELTRAMDEIVWAVNPEHDTLDSLGNYLGKFAQEFLGSLGIRCRLDLPMQLPQWPITAEVRHHLFLAFKEALHNIVKHAAASEVTVSLITAPDSFTLAVRDNGRGFVMTPKLLHDAPRSVSRNGLVNMYRRLKKISGRWEIQTAPGEGTEVKFRVPAPPDSFPPRKFFPVEFRVPKNRDTLSLPKEDKVE
jgi:ligand-binding sensor domain-containing protein/signal transduction histidine kinase